jgi:cysteine desulfuration protein SufE
MVQASDRLARLEALAQDFDLLEEWDDKYRHLIELGRALPPLSEAERIEVNKVQGCASQVWVVAEAGADGAPRFRGDSDAHIVRGLVALALEFVAGLSARQILEADAMSFFARLGLADHLTQQRANGLRALIERIRAHARASLSAQT